MPPVRGTVATAIARSHDREVQSQHTGSRSSECRAVTGRTVTRCIIHGDGSGEIGVWRVLDDRASDEKKMATLVARVVFGPEAHELAGAQATLHPAIEANFAHID